MIRRTLALLLALAAALSAAAEVEIRIRAEALVAAPRATLADVAELGGDPAAVARIAGLVVAELPTLAPAGIDRRLVMSLAARPAAPAVLRIAGSGTVARRARTFSADELAAAAAVAAQGAETALVRVSGALTVPDGAVLAAEPLDALAEGEVPFRVRAIADGREAGRALVVLRLTRQIEVAVAARPIARGETVGPDALTSERRAASRANLAAAVDPRTLLGGIAVRAIAAGEPVAPAMVAPPLAVRAGSAVTAVWPGRGFSVELSGTALSDARPGERVGIRRQGDAAILQGIAQPDGTVLLQR